MSEIVSQMARRPATGAIGGAPGSTKSSGITRKGALDCVVCRH